MDYKVKQTCLKEGNGAIYILLLIKSFQFLPLEQEGFVCIYPFSVKTCCTSFLQYFIFQADSDDSEEFESFQTDCFVVGAISTAEAIIIGFSLQIFLRSLSTMSFYWQKSFSLNIRELANFFSSIEQKNCVFWYKRRSPYLIFTNFLLDVWQWLSFEPARMCYMPSMDKSCSFNKFL
jgi:hypothetical protein